MIVVNDNPNTGACDVVDHFKKAIKDADNLHGIPVITNDNATEDSVVIYSANGVELHRWKDGDALRVDSISNYVKEIIQPVLSWDQMVQKLGVK